MSIVRANSVYSALGRIRRVFIFDSRQYRLSEEGHPLQRIIDAYKGMVDCLNEGRSNGIDNIEVHVFFRINPWYPRLMRLPKETRNDWEKHMINRRKELLENIRREPGRKDMFVADINMKLICINCDATGSIFTNSIPSKWVQDIIEIIPGKLLIQPGLSRMKKKLMEYLKGITISDSSGKWQGGNILRGTTTSGDYIISAIQSFVDVGPDAGRITEELRRSICGDTGVSGNRIIDIGIHANTADPLLKQDYFRKLFFHADMYCTLVGPNDLGEEILLMAKTYGERDLCINTPISALAKLIKEQVSKAQKIPFKIFPVPVILLRDDKGWPMYVLSYNNCLVENFSTHPGKKQRQINLYLPDYRTPLNNYVRGRKDRCIRVIILLLEMFIDLHASEPSASEVISALGKGAPGSLAKAEALIEAMITTAQRRIADTLKQAAGVDTVTFLKYPFRQYAKRQGSLHCMTKVIERDMLG